MPTTPEHSPKTVSIPNHLDINSNTDKPLPVDNELNSVVSKDHYDRRKSDSNELPNSNTSPNSFNGDSPIQDLSCDKINEIEDVKENKISETVECPLNVICSNGGNDDLRASSELNHVETIDEKLHNMVSKEIENSLETHKNSVLKNVEDLKVPFKQLEESKYEQKGIDDFNTLNNSFTNNENKVKNIPTDIISNNIKISNELEVVNHINTYDLSEMNNVPFVDADVSENNDILDDKSEDGEVVNTRDLQPNESINHKIKIENENDDILLEKVSNISNTTSQIVKEKFHVDDLAFPDDCSNDFADFTGFQYPNLTIPFSENQMSSSKSPDSNKVVENVANVTTEVETTNDDDFTDHFDDFGDFVSTSTELTDNIKKEEVNPLVQDDLGDNNDDDFGDFQDISTAPIADFSLPSNPLEKAQKLFEETFPKIENDIPDYVYIPLGKDDHIFDILKDITDTPALTYQWPKSSSQKLLLKALNIDERNIVSIYLI